MSLPEERLILLEHTVAALRADFLQTVVDNTSSMAAVNRTLREQALKQSDADHELTILTGVLRSQGQDIKEIKNRLEVVDQHLTEIKHDVGNLHAKFDRLEQLIIDRLPPS